MHQEPIVNECDEFSSFWLIYVCKRHSKESELNTTTTTTISTKKNTMHLFVRNKTI